jgi:hypothetical protein
MLSLLRSLFITTSVTFVVWTVGTALRLVLPPRNARGV